MIATWYINFFLVPPGQPHTLSVETIGATWTQICWEAPFDVDFPISRYEIISHATDNPDTETIIRNMSTPDNTTFVNITNLLPVTTYNITVVAVIEAGDVIARSVESAPLGDIMTGFTGKCDNTKMLKVAYNRSSANCS